MKRTINKIVIHCSATPNGRPNTAADINAWHKARGFKRSSQYVRVFSSDLPNIGYHVVIETDGKIVYGRHLEEVGAGVVGHNKNAVHVLMMGTDQYSSYQWDSLKKSLIYLASQIYGKGTDSIKNALAILKMIGIDICGHRDLSPDKDGDGQVEKHEWLKTCPGFDVRTWVDNLRKQLPGELYAEPS
jgi:N-acetylmuramoyl-L-alanine amidase